MLFKRTAAKKCNGHLFGVQRDAVVSGNRLPEKTDMST